MQREGGYQGVGYADYLYSRPASPARQGCEMQRQKEEDSRDEEQKVEIGIHRKSHAARGGRQAPLLVLRSLYVT